MDLWREMLRGSDVANCGLFKTQFAEPGALQCAHSEERTGFQYIAHGEAMVTSDRLDNAIHLKQGDLIFLTKAMGHRIGPRLRWEFDFSSSTHPEQLGDSVGPPMLTVITGGFGFHRSPNHPLLSSVPWCLTLRAGDMDADPALASALRLIAVETQQGIPAEDVRRLLVELLYQYLFEHWAERNQGPWTMIVQDQRLYRALNALHTDIANDWTVTDLARESGMSRATFVLRFREMVGETPARYLARLRVQRASELLKGTDQTLTEIAGQLGYPDAFTFSKAFKRIRGCSPREYRRAV